MLTKTFLIVSLLIGTALTQNPPANDEQAIRKLAAGFVDAWNKHDAHALAENFAEDADFTNVRGDSAHGRKAVEDFHAPVFATRFKNTHQTADDIKIRFLSSDIASVDIRWEMTGALEIDGTPIPIRKGLLNWVVTRHGDRWLITVMHNQEFTPRKQRA
jgi:uncharacterized protein (TIGR02246 family)